VAVIEVRTDKQTYGQGETISITGEIDKDVVAEGEYEAVDTEKREGEEYAEQGE